MQIEFWKDQPLCAAPLVAPECLNLALRPRLSGDTVLPDLSDCLQSVDFPDCVPKKRFVSNFGDKLPSRDSHFAETFLDNLIAKQATNRFYKKSLPSVQALRPDLINTLWSLTKQLKYSLSTYYLAVSYLDAIFVHYSITKAQGSVVAYCAIMLGAKLEESIEKLPTLSQSASYFNDTQIEQKLLTYERIICECLGFSLNVKTPYALLNAFLALGVVEEDECSSAVGASTVEQFLFAIEYLANFFLEIGVLEYQFNQYPAQVVAASAVLCARCCLGLDCSGDEIIARLRLEKGGYEDCLALMLAEIKKSQSECYVKYWDKIHAMEDELLQRRRKDCRPEADLDDEMASVEQGKNGLLSRETSAQSNSKSGGRLVYDRDFSRQSDKGHLSISERKQGRDWDQENCQPVTPAKETQTVQPQTGGAFSTKRQARKGGPRNTH